MRSTTVNFQTGDVWYEMPYTTIQWIKLCAEADLDPGQLIEFVYKNPDSFIVRKYSIRGKLVYVYIAPKPTESPCQPKSPA